MLLTASEQKHLQIVQLVPSVQAHSSTQKLTTGLGQKMNETSSKPCSPSWPRTDPGSEQKSWQTAPVNPSSAISYFFVVSCF